MKFYSRTKGYMEFHSRIKSYVKFHSNIMSYLTIQSRVEGYIKFTLLSRVASSFTLGPRVTWCFTLQPRVTLTESVQKLVLGAGCLISRMGARCRILRWFTIILKPPQEFMHLQFWYCWLEAFKNYVCEMTCGMTSTSNFIIIVRV
jgi:hypothetical protein